MFYDNVRQSYQSTRRAASTNWAKLRAAVEKRASLFRRIADGSRHDARGLRKVHGHPTVAVQKDRSYAGKRQEKTEEASDNSVSCVHAVYNESVIRSVDEDRTKRL